MSIPRIRASIERPLRSLALACMLVVPVGCEGGQLLPALTDPPASTSGAGLSEREQRQLALYGAVVRNGSSDIGADSRRQAAEELIAMNKPQAIAVLAEALRSDEPAVVAAVIEAMEGLEKPVPGLLQAAVRTLETTSEENLEKLALILPRYGRQALDLVARRALDTQLAPEQRVGPIYALAAFRDREAAYQLMVLLDEQTPSPPEVQASACTSLERLTGLPYGSDAAQWRVWWEQLKDKPIEDWLRIVVQHLSERNVELEHEIRQQREEMEAYAEKSIEAWRELLLLLDVDAQFEELGELLRDDLAPVRRFAVERLERMLRDSERIPEPIQVSLAERLGDSNELSELRLECARLLNDLNYPASPGLIISALSHEKGEAIARGYLEILAKRPNAAGLDPMLLWLEDPTAGEAAANALWGLVGLGAVTGDPLTATRAAARRAFASQRTPTHARLLGAVGTENDQTAVAALLDAEDPAMRRHAAEGLALAGLAGPLLDRAADPAIYPHAVAVIAGGAATLENLATLADLVPPEAHQSTWSQGVLRLTGRLAPADLLAADDLLKTLGHATQELRAGVLGRAATFAPDTLAPEKQTELLKRLTELQIDTHNYDSAYETSQLLAGAPAERVLSQLKFKAAVLSNHYDEAIVLSGGVARVWVDMLQRLVDDHPIAATALAAEISRRFPPASMDDQSRSVYEAARQRLTVVTDGTAAGERPE